MIYVVAYLAASLAFGLLVARIGYARKSARTSHVRFGDPRFDDATVGAGCRGGLAMKMDASSHNSPRGE